MTQSEWDILLRYQNQPPGDIAEFTNLVKALYATTPDDSLVTLSLSGLNWFRENRAEYVRLVKQVCSQIKFEQEQALKQKQAENKVENQHLMKSLWISVPLSLLALWLLWRPLFAGKGWWTILGNAIWFLMGALFLMYWCYRLVHWYISQVGYKIIQNYPWKCIQCGTVVMGTIHGPKGGSRCPKCGGVMVLAGFM